MSIFDGIFGTGLLEHQRRQIGNRQPSGYGNSQMWYSQRTTLEFEPTAEQIQFARLIGVEAGLSLANRYYNGLQNNITVECLYCRTQRESRHKNCKGCGATEARRI